MQCFCDESFHLSNVVIIDHLDYTDTMTKTCSVGGCHTNHQKKVNGKSVITNPGTVFCFPDEHRQADLFKAWIRFCNRKDKFVVTNNSGVCAKHFEERLIRYGERNTLVWALNPIPTINAVEKDINGKDVPPSVLPTPTSQRKPPTDRSSPDELNAFKREDEIKNFEEISDSICPTGYKLEIHNAPSRKAIFYKMEMNSVGIPEVTQTIVIDEQLHVKLFKNSLPIPLPKWFTKGGDCRAKRKSIIQNFPTYINNFGSPDDEVLSTDPKKMPGEILEELNQIRFKKPTDGPKFSPNLLRYALLLYYTSPQGYRLLLEQFPLPSIIYLKKLSQGGIDSLKAIKLLREQGKMDKDVILMLDEIYIEKDEQYHAGKMIGADEHGNLFKGMKNSFLFSCILIHRNVTAFPMILTTSFTMHF